MTFRKEMCAQCDLRARCPELTRLTRRAFSAGVVATACGAALQLNGSRAAGNAAPVATEPGDRCPEQQAASEDATVIIENFTFSPDTLTVPVGTEVTWENRDDIPHTVTSDDKTTIASSLLDTGDRFSFQFNEAGTFDYFCSVHPMMTAKVIVQS
jgi:plastocyanin